MPYACTGKLITMLANQPQMFMQLALPALSELRTSASRERLFEVSRSMTQVMLLASGAIVVVVLATNQAVRLMVGWQCAICRRGPDGVVAGWHADSASQHDRSLCALLFRSRKTPGADSDRRRRRQHAGHVHLDTVRRFVRRCIGSADSDLPDQPASNLRALAREEGTAAMSLLVPLAPWTTRLFVLLACLAALVSVVQVSGLLGLVTTAAAMAIAYVAIMIPVLRQPPLGSMLSSAVVPWAGRAQGLVKRLAGQPVTLGS